MLCKGDDIVGHISSNILTMSLMFIWHGGNIYCKVSAPGPRYAFSYH